MSQQPSEACCSVPPAIVDDYTPKGNYIHLKDGTKTYFTGSPTAKRALLLIADIFGFFPQTIQGADILAHSNDFRVFIPDYFEGKPFSISDFPPDTDEKKAKLGDFFGGIAKPDVNANKTVEYLKELKTTKEGQGAEGWGLLGYCWGGKVAALTVQKEGSGGFKALGEVHPAMVDPKDAEKVTVPTIMLASGDEDEKAVKGFEEALKVEHKHVEIFGDQVHGWLGARAELGDKRVKEEYERAYGLLLGFYQKHV